MSGHLLQHPRPLTSPVVVVVVVVVVVHARIRPDRATPHSKRSLHGAGSHTVVLYLLLGTLGAVRCPLCSPHRARIHSKKTPPPVALPPVSQRPGLSNGGRRELFTT
ncbi:hypothetical protein K505DRAFT_143464 [Melanomma pulvis-pyrius CBS 109.77]|uniref:Uncharacterized protein n=1 Tax=Melanomma pulvis-pyrius CBS 109.77 TaxID=1314802 RepID=A0A6A6WR33_9PLEO|nr:hypothetical protein K505DRAFT_143464 [Melanomma pulvis-pyrius CBS 109.77]